MKRSGPPARRTPMKRGKPLATVSKLRPGGRLRAMSAKARARIPERQAVREAVIARDRQCRAGDAVREFLADRDARAALDGLDLGYLAAWARECQPWHPAPHVHEPGGRGRDIGSQYDAERAVLLCPPCHDRAHRRPALARLFDLYRSAA